MNTERLEHLLRQYFDGEITGDEIAELDAALHIRPDAREHFWNQAHIHGALREWGFESGSAIELRALQSPSKATLGHRERSPWLSWRPHVAAAAGVVFGLLCATVAWALASPRAVATASRLFALVDGSFEKQCGLLPSGFPVQFGLWSGDESEVVEKPSVETKDGQRSLSFVRAEREPTLPNHGAASCDVYQLVDLRSLKAEAALGEATLELSVQFLDGRESPGEPVKFICRASVFAGSPDAILAEWPLTQKESLASGSGSFDSMGGSPRSWHLVTTKLMLPPQADFAVVHLVAHKPKNPRGTEAVFGEQFADDVRLTLKTQPTLPVRLAQR